MTTLRRLLSLCSILFLVAISLLIMPPQPAGASTEATFIDWNLCSNVCTGNGDLRAADLLAFRVGLSSPKPLAITVQEICKAQWLELVSLLLPVGYQAAMYVSHTTSSNCIEHGNAIFWLGGCASGGCVFPFSYAAAHQNSEADLRGGVCGKGGFPSLLACSTHVTNLSHSTDQAEDFRVILAFDNLTGIRSFGAGDFNRTRSQISTQWYVDNYESDEVLNRTTLRSPSDPRKIDFIFYPVPGMCFGTPATLLTSDYSDHKIYFGYPTVC